MGGGILGVILGRLGVATGLAVLHSPLYQVGAIQHPFWVATSTFWASPTPNMVYGYLHVGIFLAVGLCCRPGSWPQRLWWMGAVAIHLVAIGLSYSRGWTALLLGLLVFLWQFRSRLVVAVSHVLFLLFVLLTVFIHMISNYYIRDVSLAIQDADARTSRAEYHYLQPDVPLKQVRVEAIVGPFIRPYLRRAALSMVQQRPWLGIGPGNFSQEIYRRQAQDGKRWGGLRVETPWDPHSTYFGTLAELGVPGVVALLALLGVALRQLLHPLRYAVAGEYTPLVWAVLSCLVGYLLFAVDDDLLTKRWLWCVLGLGGSAWVLSTTRPAAVQS